MVRNPHGQVDLVPQHQPDLAGRGAVVVAPSHGGAVACAGLRFGHSCHNGRSAPPTEIDHGAGNHGATRLGVAAGLEPVLAEPSCKEK